MENRLGSVLTIRDSSLDKVNIDEQKNQHKECGGNDEKAFTSINL